MELFRNIDIELVGLCLGALVVVQLLFEVRKHRRGSMEPPPRIVCLDGELGGLWPETRVSNGGDGSGPHSEAARGN